MKIQDNTIKLLIDSMTAAEKRMFKVYASAYTSDKKYMALFDAIEKQKKYDEGALKKEFPINFAVLKKYLFDSIIDSIKISGDYKDLDSWHVHEIEKYKILLHKGLSHAAEIQLRRTKKITFEDEGFIKHLYALNQEYIAVFTNDTTLENSKLKHVIAERQKVFEIISNYSFVSDVYFTLRIALKSIFYCKTATDKKIVEQIVSPLIKNRKLKLLSNTAKSLYYMTMNEYYTAIGEYDKALVSSITYLDIKRVQSGDKVELQTILENANYLFLSMKCLKLTNFETKLNWFENVMKASKQPYRFLFCYERWYVIKLRFFQLAGKKNESMEFIKNESKKFNSLSGSFALKYKAAAFYFNALSYYLNNDFRSAISNCNEIINAIDNRIEEYLYARILRLFVFIKQENFTTLEYEIRSMKRMLRFEISNRLNERKLISYLEKAQNFDKKDWVKFISDNKKEFNNDKTMVYYLSDVLLL